MTYDQLMVLLQKIIKLFGCSEQLKLIEFGRTSLKLAKLLKYFSCRFKFLNTFPFTMKYVFNDRIIDKVNLMIDKSL